MSPKIEAALSAQKRTELRVLKARLEDARIRQGAVVRAIARVESNISELDEHLAVHKAHHADIEAEANAIKAAIEERQPKTEVSA